MKLKIEFSGGLETLFEGKKLVELELQEESFSLAQVIEILRTQHLKSKEELFI